MPDHKSIDNRDVKQDSNGELPEHMAFARELQALALDAINGDKISYKLFLQKIIPHIKRYVRKQWWGDNSSEDDIIQDVLIAVHTNLHTYDPKRPILPWLKSIVTYKVVDFLRKFSRWHLNEIGQDDIETFYISDTNNQSSSVENIDYIERALDSLPQKQAYIVRMLKINGLSLKEVADQTGLSVAAVKTYAHRAYKKMLEFKEDNQ